MTREKNRLGTILNIYIGNLSYEVTDADLNGLFATYGRVVSAKVITDMETRRSKGFGFVEMESAAEAKTAIAELNGTEFQGRAITVNEARPKESNRGGGGGSRDRREGGGGQRRWN